MTLEEIGFCTKPAFEEIAFAAAAGFFSTFLMVFLSDFLSDFAMVEEEENRECFFSKNSQKESDGCSRQIPVAEIGTSAC